MLAGSIKNDRNTVNQLTDIMELWEHGAASGSYSHRHSIQHKGLFTKDRAKNKEQNVFKAHRPSHGTATG